MKSSEFIKLKRQIEESRSWFDKWMDQYVKSGEITKEQIILTEIFENDLVKFNRVNDLIKLYSQNSLSPVKGQFYAPVGFVLNAALKRLQILSSETAIELVAVPLNYVFRCNGKIHTFPHEFNDNTSAGATFFYQTVEEAHHIITTIILSLQFVEWDVEQIIIQDDGERIVK